MNPDTITPRRRWRVAVVGAGYFSQFHLQAWADMPDVDIVGLCDSDPERAHALGQRFGVTDRFTQARSMLDACAPDLVDVVLPPAHQAGVLETVLGRRLAAICQKPFGTSFQQAAGFAAAAARAGSLLVVHENFRFMPWFREAHRFIHSGELGTLHGISCRLRPGDGQGADAYLDRQPYFQTMPRLLVVETAIHFIDCFRYLAGEVDAVYARLRRLNPAIRGEDAALITFEFRNGAAGLFDGNRLNDHVADNPRRTMGEMWIEGSRGVLRLDGDARLWWKPHHGAQVQHPYPGAGNEGFGGGACAALQRHVLYSLANGSQPENTASAYLDNLRVQEAVYQSHQTGRRVVLAEFTPVSAELADTSLFPLPLHKETLCATTPP